MGVVAEPSRPEREGGGERGRGRGAAASRLWFQCAAAARYSIKGRKAKLTGAAVQRSERRRGQNEHLMKREERRKRERNGDEMAEAIEREKERQ